MQTLESSLNELVASGLVEYEEAVLHSLYPNEIERSLPVAPTGLEAAAAEGR